MISTQNGSSVGGAVHYFSADNYYTHGEGLAHSEWYGEGAKLLGLSGEIGREDFTRLLGGEVGQQLLGRHVTNDKGEKEREHRPYVDVTFSAPKSVSLLAEVAGMHELRHAHEEAVKETLDYMQRSLAETRVGYGKNTLIEKTGNLTVALFRHNTSRELDPQTHTHAVIMNATQGADGKWRSLFNDPIYHRQHTIGAIYMSTLATKVRGLGLDIEIKDKYGNFEIKGIGDAGLEHFSQRRTQIKEALAKRGIAIEDASAYQREKATLVTRKSKTEVDHALLLTDWKERAQSAGLDLDRIVCRARGAQAKTVSLSPHEPGPEPSAPLQPATGRQKGAEKPEVTVSSHKEAALEALRFAASHLHEREMVVPFDLLLRTATQHSIGQATFQEIEATYNRLVNDGTLLKVQDGMVTTNRLLRREEWLVHTIQEGQGKGEVILTPEQIQERIRQYEQIEQKRLDNPGFALTPGQRDAVELALSVDDRAVAVQGDAGTGKTTMLQAVRVIAEEQGYLVRGMSVSGSAAGTLEVETGIQSHTVKMFLIKEQQAQKEIEAMQAAGQEVHRGKEMWIVDESSFIGQWEMNHIMRLAEKAEAKVVFVGDVRQLSSPEAGKPFELGQKEGIKIAHMREIRRQKTDDLKEVVGNIVRGQNKKAFDKLIAGGMVHENKDKEELFNGIVTSYLVDRENTLIITPFNRDRTDINKEVREALRSAGDLYSKDKDTTILANKGMTKAEMQHAKYYVTGDVVLFRRGYKSLNVPDNSYLRVKDIDGNANVLTLLTKDGREVRFSPKGKSAMEVYQAEDRQLAIGDKIRFTRSSAEMKTGDMGMVKAIRGNTVTVDTGRKAVIFDLKDNRHWDHAYAVTVHASQGLTVDKTIFHIHVPKNIEDGGKKPAIGDSKSLHEIAKVFGEQSFYVGATRSRYSVEIYTNNAGAAKKYITASQEKTSSFEAVHAIETQRERGGKEI